MSGIKKRSILFFTNTWGLSQPINSIFSTVLKASNSDGWLVRIFPQFELNTEVNLRIQFEYRKLSIRNNSK